MVGVEGSPSHPLGRRPRCPRPRPVRLQRHRRHPARLSRLGAARSEDRRLQPPDAAAARPRMAGAQPPWTTPTLEVDHRRRLLRRLPISGRAGHARGLLLRQSRRSEGLHRQSAMGLAHRFLNVGARIDSGRTPACSPGADRLDRMGREAEGEDGRSGSIRAFTPPSCGWLARSARSRCPGGVDLFDPWPAKCLCRGWRTWLRR